MQSTLESINTAVSISSQVDLIVGAFFINLCPVHWVHITISVDHSRNDRGEEKYQFPFWDHPCEFRVTFLTILGSRHCCGWRLKITIALGSGVPGDDMMVTMKDNYSFGQLGRQSALGRIGTHAYSLCNCDVDAKVKDATREAQGHSSFPVTFEFMPLQRAIDVSIYLHLILSWIQCRFWHHRPAASYFLFHPRGSSGASPNQEPKRYRVCTWSGSVTWPLGGQLDLEGMATPIFNLFLFCCLSSWGPNPTHLICSDMISIYRHYLLFSMYLSTTYIELLLLMQK